MYASIDVSEDQHRASRRFLRTPRLRLHTTTIILGEVYTLLNSRQGYAVASQAIERLRVSDVVRIYHFDESDESAVWRVLEEFAGVPLSYADASLVVLGRKLRVTSVFSFDDDLRQAGLALVPG